MKQSTTARIITIRFILSYLSSSAQEKNSSIVTPKLENPLKMKTLTDETTSIIERFNNAFQSHNPAELPGIIDENCVMESIQGPDGIKYEGYDACLDFWKALATDPNTHFDVEEVFVFGDRATIRWRYYWGNEKNNTVRGVNLMRLSNGKIIEALGYAKTVPSTGLD